MSLVQPQTMLRTGTHNEPMMGSMLNNGNNGNNGNSNMGTTIGSSNNFDSPKGPAVWRRESASETVRALEKNGMETYDIPAFLRKQAD